MKYCVGIDLGSTTTKAVVMDESGHVIGRGVTNSRSNYAVACDVALTEGLISSRFGILSKRLQEAMDTDQRRRWLEDLERTFRMHQYNAQLDDLARTLVEQLEMGSPAEKKLDSALREISERMRADTKELFGRDSRRKSDFFRDLAGAQYLALAEEISKRDSLKFDLIIAQFDRAILKVENIPGGRDDFSRHAMSTVDSLEDPPETLRRVVAEVKDIELVQAVSVGTGYGRQTLPFPREQIRSEILCHGLGAHHMFEGTRTVLDIGGQDTKAIQVDPNGIVTSFQMNDRCAAGCGRYLGYIADEMNLGLHELGPLAQKATRKVRINSTCTVFAGAELRERMGLGECREDILAGLHRAVILRGMSLLARSGGIDNEFTFTGGVARNPAAVDALRQLIQENYGERTINISVDSIYTGALGAALFALRDWRTRQSKSEHSDASDGEVHEPDSPIESSGTGRHENHGTN